MMLFPAWSRPQPLLRGALVVVLLLAAAWTMFRVYTPAASRECLHLYQAARTAADTVRVDGTVPDARTAGPEAHSCGFIRSAARWW